jgi:hypothetical protein
MDVPITDLIATLNPTAAEIIRVFQGFAKIPPGILKAILQTMDGSLLKRISAWAEAFVTQLNQVNIEPAPDAGQPRFAADFLQAMQATKFQGQLITPEELSIASNAITKAVKAENWLEGVWVGISLARMVPV